MAKSKKYFVKTCKECPYYLGINEANLIKCELYKQPHHIQKIENCKKVAEKKTLTKLYKTQRII